MNKRIFCLDWLIAVCLFSSPACAAQQVDKYENIHSVAVISAIGHIPMIGGGPLFAMKPPPEVTFPDDWKLDDFVTERVATLLKPRFTVITVPSEAGLAKQLNAGFFTEPVDNFRDMLKQKPLPQPVDAIVFVVPSDVGSGYGDWNGLQLAIPGRLFGAQQVLVTAVYQIRVYDTTKWKLIDFGTAKPPDANFLNAGITTEVCTKEMWSPPDQLNDRQTQEITDEFQFIVSDSLPVALKSAGLIGAAAMSNITTTRKSAEALCHRPA